MTLVVKAHSPWKTRLVAVLGLAALAFAGWSLFEYGRYTAGFDQADAVRAHDGLVAANKRLTKTVSDLQEKQAVLQRTSQIDHQAYTDLQGNLKNLQDEILELKEELAFYRGIISPRDASPGLRLQSFRVEPTGQARDYRFTIVLTQVLNKNDTVTRGEVRLHIDGLQDGRQKDLSLREVNAKRVRALSYKFKYFQNIEGELLLPRGFKAQRVTVQVLPYGRERDKIEKTFDWPAEEDQTNVGE
jgi:hypothetical protein